MRSIFATALIFVTSTVTAQWFGPGDIPVPESYYEVGVDRFWLCSGPCCEIDGNSPSGQTIQYYDGISRDTYQIVPRTGEQTEARLEAIRVAAVEKAAAEAAILAAEAEAERLEDEADALEDAAKDEAKKIAYLAEQARRDALTPAERIADDQRIGAEIAAENEAERLAEEEAERIKAEIELAKSTLRTTGRIPTTAEEVAWFTPDDLDPYFIDMDVQCYQRDNDLANASLSGTWQRNESSYTMRLQMELEIDDDNQNTVIDNSEVAMMTVCLKYLFTDTSSTSANLSFEPNYDCCQASYTLEDYISGNYVVTAQCYYSPFPSSVQPDDKAALVYSSQKRFEVCGAKLTDNLDAKKPKDVTLTGSGITLDETNTIGRTKSFAATFMWNLPFFDGYDEASYQRDAWIESSVRGRFLTNRRTLTKRIEETILYTEYDASKAAGASFDPSELSCGGLQTFVASLAAVATAIAVLSF